MAKPKVKKSKSGTQNDSTKQNRERLKYHRRGDGGLISDKTTEVMKKKKK